MTTSTFAPPAERLAQVRAFMHERVLPNEHLLDQENDESDALVARLRDEVRALGLWAPHVPPEAGGTGTGFLDYAYLNEQIGLTVWGQLIFGCQAPDAGNAEILHMFGTEEQKQRWLFPLVGGQIRSFFSMTEPEVPGSDPTTLRTRAVRDGDDWVINGHKWFSCGAASGSVTVMTIPNAAPSAPDENHLCPLITQSSPSRTARVRSVVGSEPGTSGSVIEKNERIWPPTSGKSHRCFCSSVPNMCRISALPASGAWHPKIKLSPHGEADLFVQIGVIEETRSGATSFRRHVRRPEPERAHLVAQLGDECVRFIVLLVEQVLVREHTLVHERTHLGESFGGRREGRGGHSHSIAEE